MSKQRKPPSQTWKAFLNNRVRDLVSIDFFTVPTVSFRVLFVLVVLAHHRQRIVHFNVTEHPTARWTAQPMVQVFPEDNAELVTLSACDAAVGRRRGEEGIANLVRAYLFSGAKSVVASLWAASDAYTRTLIERFYHHIAQGEDKGSALRQAKRDLIREFGDQAVPFYWAGFVMVGDGYRSIPVSRERTP